MLDGKEKPDHDEMTMHDELLSPLPRTDAPFSDRRRARHLNRSRLAGK
jgi:hypothetical protein